MAKVSPVVGVLNFICSLIYNLTVRMAVELLKLGALLTILLGSCLILGLIVFGILAWVYAYYNYSTLAPALGFILLLPLIVVALKGVEYVVKDSLRLTDMTLMDVVRVVFFSGSRYKANKEN